jgi:hypothetical protein
MAARATATGKAIARRRARYAVMIVTTANPEPAHHAGSMSAAK